MAFDNTRGLGGLAKSLMPEPNVRLARFRYLRRQRVLALALVIALSSTLFSLIALSLASLHRGLTAYLGEEEGVIAMLGNFLDTS